VRQRLPGVQTISTGDSGITGTLAPDVRHLGMHAADERQQPLRHQRDGLGQSTIMMRTTPARRRMSRRR
jgi:hypothetical protein